MDMDEIDRVIKRALAEAEPRPVQTLPRLRAARADTLAAADARLDFLVELGGVKLVCLALYRATDTPVSTHRLALAFRDGLVAPGLRRPLTQRARLLGVTPPPGLYAETNDSSFDIHICFGHNAVQLPGYDEGSERNFVVRWARRTLCYNPSDTEVGLSAGAVWQRACEDFGPDICFRRARSPFMARVSRTLGLEPGIKRLKSAGGSYSGYGWAGLSFRARLCEGKESRP